jgi:hypothetical protein
MMVDSERTDELPWAEEPSPPPPPPPAPPLAWYLRLQRKHWLLISGAITGLCVLAAVLSCVLSDHEVARKKEAYEWSQMYVRRHLLNPGSVEFPPFPDDNVEVTIENEGQRAVVKSQIESTSPTGIRIYHSYSVVINRSPIGREWLLDTIEIK